LSESTTEVFDDVVEECIQNVEKQESHKEDDQDAVKDQVEEPKDE
jgi:hypothetical protein